MTSSKSVGVFKKDENLEHEADEFERTPVKPIKLPKQRKQIRGLTDAKSSLVLKHQAELAVPQLNRQATTKQFTEKLTHLVSS